MSAKTIGLLHPGEMGATVGAAAAASGAREAGLRDVVNLAELVRLGSDVRQHA